MSQNERVCYSGMLVLVAWHHPFHCCIMLSSAHQLISLRASASPWRQIRHSRVALMSHMKDSQADAGGQTIDHFQAAQSCSHPKSNVEAESEPLSSATQFASASHKMQLALTKPPYSTIMAPPRPSSTIKRKQTKAPTKKKETPENAPIFLRSKY